LILPVFQAGRRVQVPANIAYEVAADVGSYKDFLPLLQRSTVMGAPVKTAQGESFKAELAVAYPKLGLKEAFVSQVTTNVAARTVKAESTDGPFRSVETVWTISPAATGSDVAIRIDYAFRNPLLQIAAAGLMDMAIAKVMSAFEARAKQVLAERHALKQA
jgi:coenzyme Q-binding protein COQ10